MEIFSINDAVFYINENGEKIETNIIKIKTTSKGETIYQIRNPNGRWVGKTFFRKNELTKI